LTLNLGQSVPIPQTQFQASATGGVNNVPVTQIQYQNVGVTLSMTPKVTYDDEIILSALTVTNSSLGPDINVAGTPTTSIINRTATVTMRLRDGESNLLAGLVSENNSDNFTTLPGFTQIPILRNLFGNGNTQRHQTDIVMIVTPHIVDSHHITASDLKPMFVGTGQNLGGGTPTLISPDTPIQAPPSAPAGVPLPLAGSPTTSSTGASGAASAPPPGSSSGTSSSSAASRVVPIEAVPSTPAPQPPPSAGQIVVSPPPGPMQSGGPAYLVPLTITNVQQLGTVTVTVTYDPKVLKAQAVNQGTFMQQGGITPTFAPKIDATTGRIDIPISRPGSAPGASGTGLLAAVSFQAIGPGSTSITVSAVALTADGKPVPVQGVPANVTVK
jgi:general secretion pathway protein D